MKSLYIELFDQRFLLHGRRRANAALLRTETQNFSRRRRCYWRILHYEKVRFLKCFSLRSFHSQKVKVTFYANDYSFMTHVQLVSFFGFFSF